MATGAASPALWLVYAAWFILLLDFHFFIGIKIAGPLQRLATAVLVPLLLMVLIQAPTILTAMKSWVWYPPFFLLVVCGFVSFPKALNLNYAQIGLQYIVVYYILLVATALYVKNIKQAIPILGILAGRFIWWAFWGRAAGQIAWHPTMANFDGFGGLMVQGFAICYWFAMATSNRKVKLLLLALAAYCVTGVVASFARGAFLALVAMGGMIWLRSPRKVATAGGMIGAVIVTALAASFLFEGNAFWDEMKTIFEEGTEEGTGAQRWALWTAATKVWLANPAFGVGLSNFGVYSASFFKPGEIEGFENPGAFYAYNTHNAYFQIIAELGTVGIIAFGWCVWDFFKKNKDLKSPEAAAVWNATGYGAKYNLRYLALGLEGAVISTLLVNMVYASFYEPWFVSAWAANRMLWALVSPNAVKKPPASVPQPRVSQRAQRFTTA